MSDLPAGVTEEELTALFKDVSLDCFSPSLLVTSILQCGKVREVKITELSGAIVATVEFFERVSSVKTSLRSNVDWLRRRASLRP